MNPFEDHPVITEVEIVQPRPAWDLASRPHLSLFVVIASLTWAMFLPWALVRVPGTDAREYSLFDFAGGTPMVFSFFFFCSVGLILWTAKLRFGRVLTSIAVGFIGWFGVLISVSIGVVRGLIPQVGIGNIDLGRGLVGVGPGSIIAAGGLLLVAMEALPRWEGSKHGSLNGFGVAAFLLALILALTHTAVWVSGESDKFESAIRLSGDSLFGSFVISALVWTMAVVGVVSSLRDNQRGEVILAVVMTLTGLVKFFHALLFVLGQGLVNLLLPNRVGEISAVRSHWPLWTTLVLSLVCVALGAAALISRGVRATLDSLSAYRFLPSVILVIFTLLAAFGGPISASNESTMGVITDSTSTGSTGETPETTTAVDDGNPSSADYISRSVVLVLVSTSAGEVCWSGSGVAVLDGGTILTNNHVVVPELGDDPSCSVLSLGITDDPTREPTRFVGAVIENSDEDLDLAVLKMDETEQVPLRPLPISQDQLTIDTKIRVIGYPGVGGNTITLSEGVISGVDRRSGTEFYKVSAQISPGNSGGPMVDSQGNLVGIATAYLPADVTCKDRDTCYAAGANLGLVRPIALANSILVGS